MKTLKKFQLFLVNAWKFRRILSVYDKPRTILLSYIFLKQNLIDMKLSGAFDSADVATVKNVDRCIDLIEKLQKGDYYERCGGEFLTYDNMSEKEARLLYATKSKGLLKSLALSSQLEKQEKDEIRSLFGKIYKSMLEQQVKLSSEMMFRFSKISVQIDVF